MQTRNTHTGSSALSTLLLALGFLGVLALVIGGNFAEEKNKQYDLQRALARGELLRIDVPSVQGIRMADVTRYSGRKPFRSWSEQVWGYFDAGKYRIVNPEMASEVVCPELQVGYLENPDSLSHGQLENWGAFAGKAAVTANVQLITRKQGAVEKVCPWLSRNAAGQWVMEGKVLAVLLKINRGTR